MIEGKRVALIGSNEPGTPLAKSRSGIYDPNIVCEDCERRFSPWDTYGVEFLLRTDWSKIKCVNGKRGSGHILDVGDFDYAKMKLFVLSVLWRMHETSQPFFESVDLGPFADEVRQMLLAADPGGADAFAVVLSRFTGPALGIDPKQVWLNPQLSRWDGVNSLRFWLSDFSVLVKVDQRPPNKLMSAFALAPHRRLVILLRDFAQSKEFLAQLRVANSIDA